MFFLAFLSEKSTTLRSGAGRASHACASACLVLGQAKEAGGDDVVVWGWVGIRDSKTIGKP